MLYAFVAFVGVLVGAVSMYVLVCKQMSDDLRAVRKDRDLLRSRAEAIYAAGFGPYGLHHQILVDSFNALWLAIGKERKGIPPG